ncbi:MAG TPA: hypothetical protein DCZ94_08910 [Lentisphaeria bacterium]|nr:MAG: hypothetical protein A2X48_23490 [Lentisphaerae bacterium GWF2_49_21]HBC87060.1 hypothetical protein [Lentisphaeria bacterium]
MKAKALAAILAAMAVCPLMAQQPQMYDDRPKITVGGEAVVNVEPDKIVISLGIETKDKDIMAAKQQNNDIMKKTIAVLRESGIADKDIQTDNLSIEPRYGNNYTREDFHGYFVRNTLAVTLKQANKVEEVVTRVLQAGVNYIHGIDFQTTELKKYREQARELALKAAKEKAVKMAEVLGQSVGMPVQISENSYGTPWWYYSSWSGWGYGRGQGGMSQNVVQNVQGGSGEISESIALGKISIRANVNVTFELKK